MSRTGYRIRTLATPGVETLDGSPVEIPVGKPLALLIYLAHHPDGVLRSDLATLLWPDSPRNRARGSVRQALWTLKKELGAETFAELDPVRLAEGAVRTDLQELREELKSGPLEQALSAWDTPPFLLFASLGAPSWETWADNLRTEVERELGRALLDRGQALLAEKGPGEALSWLDEALRIEPHRRETHEARIGCLLLLRRLDEAEDAISRARETLGGEGLDWPELEELTAGVERARAGEPAASGASGWGERPPGPPVVGHQEPYDAILRLWALLPSRGAQVGTVVGEAGSGKSLLLSEVARAIDLHGGRVVRVQAMEGGEELAWSGVAALVNELISVPGAAGISIAAEQVLRQLAPSKSNDPDLFREGIEPSRPVVVVDALADLLEAVSEEAPLFLALDDLHWMDEVSRRVLVQLLRRLGRERVLALVTSRPVLRPSPLARSLDQLTVGRSAHAFELERWGRPEVEELVDSSSGILHGDSADLNATDSGSSGTNRSDGTGRSELHELWVKLLLEGAGGHPRLTVRLLEALGEEDEAVRAARRTPPPLPQEILDRARRELDRLEGAARRVTEVLDQSADPLSIQALREQTGLEQPTLLRGLNELLRRGLLRRRSDLTFEFAHPAVQRLSAETRDRQPATAGGPLLKWGAGVGGLVMLAGLIAALLLPPYTTAAPEEAPFGGGTLYMISASDILAFHPTGPEPEAWAVESLSHWLESPVHPEIPYRDGAGRLHWLARAQSATGKPWVVHLSDDGVRPLYRSPGDDFVHALSPDHSTFLVASEPRGEGLDYQLDLYTSPLAPTDQIIATAEELAAATNLPVEATGDDRPPHSLLAHRSGSRGARYSPDGRRVAHPVRGAVDSVSILTPRGDPLLSVPVGRLEALTWCGDSGTLILIRTDEGEGRLHEVDLETGRLDPMPQAGPVGNRIACSPDGSTLVYPAAPDGEPTFIVQDVATGDWTRLPWDYTAARRLVWTPDQPGAVPTALSVDGPDEPVGWGESLGLRAKVTHSDGQVGAVEGVEWDSEDPNIASVSPGGVLHANGVGRTTIRAVWDGWLEAHVEVEVVSDEGERAAFVDPFSTLDPEDWVQVGWPPAQTVEREGEQVLLLPGDALYRDGILSREARRFPRGLTAEVEFRLPLNRRDKQWFFLCLVESELPPDPDAGFELHDLPSLQQPCLRYPEGRLDTFDPTSVSATVVPGFAPMRLHVSDTLSTDDWTHLALQMRADGTLTYFVNRTPVGTSSIRVDNDPEVEWRILILGSSWETEALARNLLVWDGPRY
jgi:DNA-binding SARP family transcriptional activator